MITTEELDKWSAEKVMGWPLCKGGGWYLFHPKKWYADKNQFNDGVDAIWAHKWSPSDPATGQIWLVIGRMQELGWWLSFNAGPGRSPNALFEKNPQALSNYVLKNSFGAAMDSNPCLAILMAARAALK